MYKTFQRNDATVIFDKEKALQDKETYLIDKKKYDKNSKLISYIINGGSILFLFLTLFFFYALEWHFVSMVFLVITGIWIFAVWRNQYIIETKLIGREPEEPFNVRWLNATENKTIKDILIKRDVGVNTLVVTTEDDNNMIEYHYLFGNKIFENTTVTKPKIDVNTALILIPYQYNKT